MTVRYSIFPNGEDFDDSLKAGEEVFMSGEVLYEVRMFAAASGAWLVPCENYGEVLPYQQVAVRV